MLFVFIFAVVGRIRFAQWWVWRTWIWLQILWYVLFSRFLFAFLRVRSWYFGVWHFCTNMSQVQRWLTPCILLGLKFLIFPPSFKIIFMVMVWLCNHRISNCCSFSKNMIWLTPMGNIHRPSNSGRGGPDTGTFIKCVNGIEPQIPKLWCWDIDRICREVHRTARVDILSRNVG